MTAKKNGMPLPIQSGLTQLDAIQQDFDKLTKAEIIRRRHFNTAEREALYIAAGGLCAICGITLDELWEPDHIIPFSDGGITDVTNGQATCRPCNRRKGARNA